MRILDFPTRLPVRGWGVYVLVLTKKGKRAKLYIDSGTAIVEIKARIHQHDRLEKLSRFVQSSVKDGYVIASKRFTNTMRYS